MKKNIIKLDESDINKIVTKLINKKIKKVNEHTEDNDFLYPDEIEPDSENDAFISSNGWKYSLSFGGKFLGEADEIDVALNMMRQAFDESPNYKPTLWFVSDHGNSWSIDLDGHEIK